MHISITSTIDFVIFLCINVKLFNTICVVQSTPEIKCEIWLNASLLPTNDFILKSEQSLDLKQ